MFKVKILHTKKTKEKWLEQAVQEYEKRMASQIKIKWVLVKNLLELEQYSSKEDYICLDSSGSEYTSETFAAHFFHLLEICGSRLTIVIGPDTGLSKTLLASAKEVVSLSKLTFTHQMVRLVLTEQIYRALMIRNHVPYHK